ncbi:P-loop NTPase fold protein [Rhodanobacter aciditrophus]|uniref:P-loop NTPase fold protein n=1 Tax=Rhodanobacter aciditrophus TaxID=1623218 RepID=A0ABW4AYS7_9GAMM
MPKRPFENCATGSKRKKLAERFTQYLITRNTEEHAFPVNLNGAWGTGKTFFVENWKRLVEEKGHIGIKIDAWESDYLDDPLTIIIAEIIDQLSELTRKDGFYEQEKKVVHFATQLKGSIPKILTSLLGKLIGDQGSKELLELFESIVGSAVNAKDYKSNLNIGDLGLETTRAHIRHKQFTKDFKREVQKLVEFAQPDTPKEKVFIFIDELDRCRPSYAIEMLETVKHLFDIPNFVFIFSTDTKQLQHSIKAIYGQDFDSHEYLSRFFEQRLTLPEPDYLEFIKAQKIFEGVNLCKLLTLPKVSTTEELQYSVSLICQLNKNHLPLRRVRQLCSHLESLLLSDSLDKKAFSILTLTGLVFGEALYTGIPEFEKFDSELRAMKAYTGSEKIVDFYFTRSIKMTKLLQDLNGPLSQCQNKEAYKISPNSQFKQHEFKSINADYVSLNNQIDFIRRQPNVTLLTNPAEMLNIIRSTAIAFDGP